MEPVNREEIRQRRELAAMWLADQATAGVMVPDYITRLVREDVPDLLDQPASVHAETIVFGFRSEQ